MIPSRSSTELVEVHGAGPVLIDLGDDPVQVFLREVGVHLCDDPSELGHCDEARPVFVKESERLFQLCPHRLRIGVLNEKLSAELSKLSELNRSRAVLVDLR